MNCADWANSLLAAAMLLVPLCIAIHKSPKAKRALAIRLLASADADEYRSNYYESRITALREDCKALPRGTNGGVL